MVQKPNKILLLIIGSATFLWLTLFLAPFHFHDATSLNNPYFIKDTIESILLIGFFFLNYLILIPKFYFNNKILNYSLLCVTIFLFILFIPTISFQWLSPKHHEHFHENHEYFNPFFPHLRFVFSSFLSVLLFSLVLKINSRWRKTEEEKLSTQLSYLKGQINPHFLFNTLNSIYYLASEKSEKTPDAIIRLSNMMRFVITEANQDVVSLTKEISYITNFIELQKLRLGHTAVLNYKIAGSTIDKKIAPLILIPFIENTFKHGVNPEEISVISIEIEINNQELVLKVENKKVKKQTKEVKSGLGIQNAKNRLALLYPQKHQLSVEDLANDFKVTLKLQLL